MKLQQGSLERWEDQLFNRKAIIFMNLERIIEKGISVCQYWCDFVKLFMPKGSLLFFPIRYGTEISFYSLGDLEDCLHVRLTAIVIPEGSLLFLDSQVLFPTVGFEVVGNAVHRSFFAHQPIL
jgi:hypothetical protein